MVWKEGCEKRVGKEDCACFFAMKDCIWGFAMMKEDCMRNSAMMKEDCMRNFAMMKEGSACFVGSLKEQGVVWIDKDPSARFSVKNKSSARVSARVSSSAWRSPAAAACPWASTPPSASPGSQRRLGNPRSCRFCGATSERPARSWSTLRSNRPRGQTEIGHHRGAAVLVVEHVLQVHGVVELDRSVARRHAGIVRAAGQIERQLFEVGDELADEPL